MDRREAADATMSVSAAHCIEQSYVMVLRDQLLWSVPFEFVIFVHTFCEPASLARGSGENTKILLRCKTIQALTCMGAMMFSRQYVSVLSLTALRLGIKIH